MRIVVLGAGAVGGYFGGRLAQSGADVAFVVRPARRAQLDRDGLVLRSAAGGDATVRVRAVESAAEAGPAEIALLTCKAYDLDAAMDAVAPAVGAGTTVVPLLNGLAHLDRLDSRFGRDRVVGGVARIAATLTREGEIRHMSPFAEISVGERGEPGRVPPARPALQAFATAMARSGFTGTLHDDIVQDMWDKWIMLCSLAAITCMMRATTGQILESDEGEAIVRELLEEARATAEAAGRAPTAEGFRRITAYLTTRGSQFAASMMRDLEGGGRIEAEHVVGDMLRRARKAGVAAPLLRVAYAHLQTYQVRSGKA